MTRNNIKTTEIPATPTPGFLVELLGHIKTSIIATIALAIIVSGAYPLIVWGIAQAAFSDKANGSLLGKDGQAVSKEADAVGSSLIGQGFSASQYFHPRPSAAGSGYDATASGGSNLGPTSAKLMFGTTKLTALTVFASDKSRTPVVPVNGRLQATVLEVNKTTIAVTILSGEKKTFTLDPAIASPNAAVNFHGRTIHPTTLVAGALVELKFNEKTPAVVTGINVIDQEIDGIPASIDTSANKITMADSSSTVINFDPKNTLFVVNGKADAKATDISADQTIHAVASLVEDNDGVADRVIHYCQDNAIDYKSSIADNVFMDADGLDDVKLITAFNASTTPPTIDPVRPIPADAVTASGSGLDPHISPINAIIQAKRIATARNVPVEKVNALVVQFTDKPSLGILGDAGVNVLRLNLALDKELPMPAAAPVAKP